MDIEQLATSKVVELISRTNQLTADINAVDKKPIWDGSVYVYDTATDNHTKGSYRASIPVQVKGTKCALVCDGVCVHYELETDDLNAYLTNRPTVFFVVTMDKNGEHRTVYHRVFKREDTAGILNTMKAGQRTKTLSFSLLPTEPDALERLFLALADEPYSARPMPVIAAAVGDPFLYNAETVTFLGRDAEITELDAFLCAAGGFRWWGVAAAGGAGKTRLAYEWGQQADARGWSVHWLGGRDYNALDQWSEAAAPTLLIADYAWQHVEALGKWMDALYQDEPYHPVRVLLLERDAGEEGGEYPWEKQLYQAGNEAHLKPARYAPMLRLAALDDDALTGLMRSFAVSLKTREPELPDLTGSEEKRLLVRLDIIDPDRRPLLAMLLTDAALRGAGVPNSREELLERIVVREKAQCLMRIPTLAPTPAQKRVLERLSTELRLLATALGADGDLSTERLAALLPEDWKQLTDCAEQLGLSSPEELLLDLGLLRVTNDGFRVPALRPDLLGEYALLRALRDCGATQKARRDTLYTAALGEGELLRQFAQLLLIDYAALLNCKPELWARLFPNLSELDSPRAAAYSHLLHGAFGRCTDREQRLTLLADMEQCTSGVWDETTYAGTVYNHLGGLYWNLGNYNKAVQYFGKFCDIMENVYGAEHPDTAESYNNLGVVYRDMGDLPKALEYHKKALDIREKVLGAEHPDTAESYNNLGVAYRDIGNLLSALKYCIRALAIREKVLGAEHPDTANCYNNLGRVYRAMDDLPKALKAHKKALEIREKVLGTEHPDTAYSCNNLGTIYRDMGNLPKALEAHKKALEIKESVLGMEHTSTALSYYNLSFIYSDMHNLPDALRYAERALTIFQTVLGAEHPDTKLAQEQVDHLKEAQP